ncbi:MAG: type II toxin-antitoxin system RelE/ParE family toxin [Sphingomonadaceae bacterium]
MSGKRLDILPRAELDVEAASDYYSLEVDEHTAFAFVAALSTSYARITDSPKTGSPRYAHELNVAGLRHVQLKRFPYLVFYVERADRIEIWRVLHAKRDIPTWLASANE